MVAESFLYPFRDGSDRSALAALLGCGLGTAIAGQLAVALYPATPWLVPALVAPLPLVAWAGYCRHVVASTVADRDAPLPSFGDARARLRDGVVLLAVTVAYLAVPAGMLLVTVQGATRIDPATITMETGTVVLLGSTLTMFVALAVGYVYPAVVARRLDREDAPLFHPGGLLYVIRNPSYLVAWAAAMVVAFVGFGVSGQLFGGRGVPGLLAGLVAVYASVVAARLVGIGYVRSR
ncbi:DUF4013 domain-containing protein [Haloarchaeobius iranensis]|uniref:Uncharacterized protein n=1 Tax=Haloarchaeobius iranensis TaxID=996166 RepID=A0A1G9Z7C3_9EURY|nr:DUF4013 domain-containing protein [Haloarchaeobius iranensis]SDN17037.1 Protein of unknown function [Haloarchaeobius iranensis]